MLGRYELVSMLGEGEAGKVWRAVLHGPLSFWKEVAIKTLDDGPPDDPAHRMLINEARLGALLGHPNLIGIHELGNDGDQWFVAMELVRGFDTGTMAKIGLPASTAIEVGIQACAALQYIHGLHIGDQPIGLVHRNIKPQNLLVDHLGIVKILDLGVARLIGADSVGGTPEYMAPEQAAGQVDPRADLFSLGVTLCELVVGARPYTQLGRAATTRVWSEDLLHRLDRLAPGLRGVLERAFCADPDARWQDASSFASALEAVRAKLKRGPTLAEWMVEHFRDADPAEPPTVGRAALGGNLRAGPGAFVGRRADLEAVLAHIRGGADLVTLTGPGGMGKTTLALAAAHALKAEWGAWFIDLSDVEDLDDMCARVAKELGVKLQPNGGSEPIASALARRGQILVVLDNLEQLLPDAAETISQWTLAAPGACVLVTSRRIMRMREEKVVQLGPLSAKEGVELFEMLSPAKIPQGQVSDVSAIVDRLDGLPLALTLAAAWTRVMPVTAILKRVDQSSRMLSGGARDLPERHRSLRAALSASWSLLAPHEPLALGQLAVFADGCSLDAAEATMDLSVFPDAPWALEVLSSLVDQSLLQVDTRTGRFRMLLTVREHALETLSESERDAARDRHARFHAEFGSFEALEAQRRDRVLSKALHTNLDNLVAACKWAVERGEADVAAATTRAACEVLLRRGPFPLAAELVRSAQEIHVVEEPSLLILEGKIAAALGSFVDAAANADRAIAIYSAKKDAAGEARALMMSASVMRPVGLLDDMEAVYRRALALARKANAVGLEGRLLGQLGQVFFLEDRDAEARASLLAALDIARRMGIPLDEARAHQILALLDASRGRLQEATTSLERALLIYANERDRFGWATCRGQLAMLVFKAGRRQEAIAKMERANKLLSDMGADENLAINTANLGWMLRESGEPEAARQQLTLALQIANACSDKGLLSWIRLTLAMVELDGGNLDNAVEQLKLAEVVTLEFGERKQLGHLYCCWAEVWSARGDTVAAQEALREAGTHAQTDDARGPSTLDDRIIAAQLAVNSPPAPKSISQERAPNRG